MSKYRSSRVLPAVLTVVVIIIAVAGIVALARLLFTGTSSSSSAPKEDVNLTRQSLLSTADGRAVSMTVRGPIVADEDFRSYRIIVSPGARQFRAFNGYLETETNNQTLSNNVAAYDQFVNALDKANLVAGKEFDAERNNLSGICASGKVYEFKLLNVSNTEHLFWTSTCGGSKGSLKGNVTQLSGLFLNQVPDGSNIADSLRL